MPTYEYACRSCNHRLDAFQSMRDEPLTTCPKCGEPTLKRLIGRGAGIIFKGSGFYETDYKRPRESGESGSGDSKPATAAAPAAAPGTTASSASASTSTSGTSAPASSTAPAKTN